MDSLILASVIFIAGVSNACLTPSGIGDAVTDVYSAADLNIPGSIFFGFGLPSLNDANDAYETPIQFRHAVFQNGLLYQTMSSYEVARAREQIQPGVVDHLRLVQKLRDYKSRINS